MNPSATLNYDATALPKAPRWGVGLLIALVMWLIIKIPEWVAPTTMFRFGAMVWGPMLGTAAMVIWWLGFSRVPWATRWWGLAAFVLGMLIAFGLGHPSMRPMGLLIFAMPINVTLMVIWVAFAARKSPLLMRAGLVLILLVAWSFFATLRMDGLTGSIEAAISWRWSPTAEDRYLASRANRGGIPTTSLVPTILPAILADGDWPGFRGARRDGRLTGTSIRTDWGTHPPKQLWKHQIGPGWSSFCVVGDRVFTQEQRGELEVVVCIDANSGAELWSHTDQTRFNESMAGAGPRATPTFADGKLYALGANGRLNCLEPSNGTVIWSRDIAADTGASLPMWGFSSSPLVNGGMVTVITGAPGKAVIAYDALSGKQAWSSGDGWSYASPQLARVGGIEQILFVSQTGLSGVNPTGGQTLWHHDFQLSGGANRAVQPTVIGDNDLLLGAAFGTGTRRINVTREGSSWKNKGLWTSRNFNPYYNDLVYHKGFCYGFDNSVFACLDAETGKSKWRAHGYGNGQVLLLVDQDLLLILTEKGEVVLVDAKPDGHHEIGRFQAIEGKTWNHPVVAQGKLFVRNGEEVAGYEVK